MSAAASTLGVFATFASWTAELAVGSGGTAAVFVSAFLIGTIHDFALLLSIARFNCSIGCFCRSKIELLVVIFGRRVAEQVG
jgi:Na+/H+-dicarboxylate symporter